MLEAGTEVVPYEGPAPFEKEGAHRNVILLFEQEKKSLDVTGIKIHKEK